MTNIEHLGESHDQYRTLGGGGGGHMTNIEHLEESHDQYRTLGGVT